MPNNENLQLGLSLNVDLEAFKKEWADKQADIQKIIDGHTFRLKIGGVQGLDDIKKQMESFSRGIRSSTKLDLVNTDSIKGLKDQLRALEQEWANLSKQQKFANESTRELTPYAVELATRYAELRAELERYGMSLKEAEKAGKSFAANRARIAAEDITQPDFELLQMAEYYKIIERESAKAYEAKRKEQEIEAKMGESLAQAVIIQNQMTQARNADYAALVKQLAAEEKLAETLHNESLRREAYQSMGQRDFIFDQMAEYYKNIERASADAYAKEKKEIDELTEKIRQERQAQQSVAMESQRVQRILSQTPTTLQAINERLSIQRDLLSKVTIGSQKYKEISADIASLEQRLRDLNATQQRNVATTNAQTAAFQRQSGVLNGLKQFMNAYVSILGTKRLVESIKDITAEFELQRVSLRAITQDAAFADVLFAKIKTSATESPFSTKDLVTYTKQLAAYRVENEKLFDTMSMLSDVSAGLGVGMDRLILAYGQVKAASVLRGTELRQFTEAGIPMVDELARKFSQLRGEVVSTGEVFDLISTRQVPFEMVADIFKEMTAEGGRFYEMQKKQSESLYGVYENLKDNIQNAFDEIGQSNRGLLMGFGKLATVGAKNLNILTAAIAPLVVGMGAYRAATVLATKGTLGLSVSTNLLARAEQSLALAGRQVMIGRAKSVGLLKKAKAANDAYALSVIRAYRATNIFAKSFHLLKAAIIANPIGAIITALTAAYSAFSAYSDKLASVSGAHERAAKAIEETKKTIESEPKFTAFKSLSNDLKKQESLLKSTKLSYKDFMKIYPELAKEFESEADWKKALNSADVERQKILSQIKSAYPEYFSYLDAEKGKVEDLAKGYAKMEEAMRLKQAASLEQIAQGLDKDIKELEGKKDSWWKKFWYGDDLTFFGADAPFIAELKGKQEEVKAIRTEIEALKKASQDASEASAEWRQNYKQLVMGGFMDNQALAMLQFGSAVESAQKKADELREEFDRLQRIPPAELDPSLVNRLEKIKSEYADIIKFLKMYNQELDKANKKGAKTKFQELRSEFQMVQKIYKEYEDLRKVLGDDAAAEEIKKAYSAVTNIDFLSPSLYKKRLKMLADAVAKTHVTIRKSSADLTGQQISDTKKWTKAYVEQLKIWEQSGRAATKAYKVKDKDGNPIGNWTVGWGFENLIDEAGNWKKVTKDTTMTLEEANKQLELQLQYRSGLLDNLLSTYQDLELTANQYSALLDIVYNTKGQEKNVDKILKAAEGDINKIPELLKDAFTRAAATGEQMPGLVDRAAGRAAMFAADLSSAISQQFSKISIDSIENLSSYLAMQIQKAIGDVDIDEIIRKMDAIMSKVSETIKRQESASNFFEEILGITGNTELSTKLTLGITGVDINSGNSRQLFAQQLAEMLSNETIREEVKTELNLTGTVKATELEKAISTGEVSIARLQLLIEKMPKDIQPKLREALSSFVDFNKKQTEDLLALIPEFGDFNDKLNSLMEQRTAKEFKVLNMVKPPEIDEAEWKAIIDKALAAIQNEYDQEVGKLDFSNFQKVFADELSNLDAVTVDVVNKMIAQLQGFLSKGELDPSLVKSITDLIDKLRDVKFDKRPVKEFRNAWKDLIDAIKKGDKEGKTAALSNLQKALESTQSKVQKVENALGGVIDVATGVADALGLSFSPETEEAIKAFKNGISIVTGALSAMLAVVIVLASGLGALFATALALGALFAVFSWFSGDKVREANKEIERQEKLLKNLDRAYKRLDEIQEGLVGNDWVRNQQRQIMNLSKQVEAFQAQLNAERSKDKSADEDAIEDYTDKILGTQKEMRDLRREIMEEMSGTNLADAARDFAQSWLDAYLSFDDTMGALKASFKDMMKSMFQNSMLAKVVQKRLEPVFNAIDNAYADANLTPAEWQKILNMGNEAIDYLDEDLTHLAEMLDLRSQLGDTQVSDLTGIAKGVAQASEETVLTLAGYANSILYYQVWIKDDVAAIRAILEGKSAAVTPISGNESGFNVGQLISLQQQSLSQLQAINANTGNTVTQLQALNDKIDSVISAQGTSARKVVNTRLSN